MHSLIVLFAATGVGVDYGWQPNPQGEMEYIIQIEPELLDALLKGDEITSRIDPRVEGVRRFRIRVGSQTPPKIGTTTPTRPDTLDRKLDKVAGDTTGSINASIPAKPDEDFDRGGAVRIQPPPLISPDRLETDSGGSFDPTGSNESIGVPYAPLKPPIESGGGGPSPIPDPDSESRANQKADPAVVHQPRKLAPLPNSGPLTGQQASYQQDVPAEKTSNLRSPSDAVDADEESGRPWTTLVLICLLLFASVGLNFYLAWIARGIYVRYRSMSGQAYENQTAAI